MIRKIIDPSSTDLNCVLVIVLQSVTMPCKNFFLSSLTPTHSSNTYPFPFSIYITGMLLNCNHGSMTSISLNYHPETYNMPSSHMLPPTHKMYNMPSSYMVSPRTSGCITLTFTIPLTLTFPVSLPLHSTHHLSSSTVLNCRNLRTYPDLTSYLSNIDSQ
jgi:hypothetical protein